MKVILDEDTCIGCETCVELCPEIFRMDGFQEKALVILPDISSGGAANCIEEAMEACPVSCIRWEE